MSQGIHQVKVVSAEAAQPNKGFERVAFFDEDGAPVDIGGGGESSPVAWADVTGKPSTFAPIVGTTATTAKAGNYTPTVATVTGLQAALDAKATETALAALEARVAALEP